MKHRRKIEFHYLKYFVVGIFILLFLALFLLFRVKPAAERETSYLPGSAQNEMEASQTIIKDIQVKQTFTGTRDEIASFDVMFGTYGRQNNSRIFVEFWEEDQLIQEYTLDASSLLDCQMQRFDLENPVTDGKGKEFSILISSDAENSEQAVSVITTASDSFHEGSFYWNGEDQKKDIHFSVNGTSGFLVSLYFLFCVIVIIGVGLIFFFYEKKKLTPEKIFLILGLTMGMFFTIFFPPFTAPDEQVHIATAYADANRILMRDPVDSNGYVYVRQEDADVDIRYDVSQMTYQRLYDEFFMEKNENIVSYSLQPLNVPLIAHLPQALGIAVSWLMGLGAIPTLYMGKIFGLLFYIFLVYWSIHFLPWGKMIMTVVALLPISLELAGSYSYDCTVNAVSFLFIGYTMYLIYRKPKLRWTDIGVLALLAAILAPCKVAYIFLCGIVFLISKEKTGGTKRHHIWGTIVLAAGGLSLIATRWSFVFSVFFGQHEQSGSNAAASGFSLMDIVGNPLHSIEMLFNTYFEQGSYYLQTLMGGSLAWLQVQISWVVIAGLVIILLLSAVSVDGDVFKFEAKGKLLIGILCLIMTGGIFLSMWMSFTPDYLSYIAGVQGRYLLPFFPLLIMMLKTKKITWKRNVDGEIGIALFFLLFLSTFDVWTYILK